jgi:hypothetical protein
LKATLDFDKLKLSNNRFNYGGSTFYVVNGTGKQLDGQLPVTVVNKGFAPAATVKKYSPMATGTNYQLVI